MTVLEWTAVLGNVGEFIGAIAVVVTLVYLAAQVRLSKLATEANTRQLEELRRLNMVENYMRRSERVERGYTDTALSNELSQLSYKAGKDPKSLDEFERNRLRDYLHGHMHRLDSQHFQYQNGMLDEEGYDNLKRVLAHWAPIWQQLGIDVPRESFRKEIEDIVASTPPDD